MPTLAELQPLIHDRARLLAWRSGFRLDADDLTQEGMLAAAGVLDRSAGMAEGHLRATARLAAWRAMVDRARRETQFRRGEDQQRAWRAQELTDAHDRADPAPGPEECVMWRQLARLLAAAIEQLPHPHRLAISLDVTEPGERAALARELGVHPSRVSQLRTAAVGMLRARLAG